MIPQPDGYTRLAVDVTSAHGAVFLFLIPFPEQPVAMGPATDCDAPAARWGHRDALCFMAQDTVPTQAVLVPTKP